ncbi:MAG TPA: MarR family transcriptional regulator [Planctomycetes bacterium]|nr:MarR family transcriptional regulator [Planctomycetota bacterium]HIL37475.1 MarR family transcriptional regulator [Planctomycetota bacterium]
MTDRVSRIEKDWKKLAPRGDTESVGVATRCRLLTEHFYQASQDALADFDLVTYEWEVLAMLLRRGSPHQASAGVIARETGRSSASITHRLDKLGERGLIKRVTSKDDGRLVMAQLTAKGKRLAQKALRPRLAAAEDIVGNLKKNERKQLNALLGKILVGVDPDGVNDI